MEIIRQFVIKDEMDLMSLNIIDWNRLNGCWYSPDEAVVTITSWFRGHALATECVIHNFKDAPEAEKPFPGWDHVGGHESEGMLYWNWFYWNHPGGVLKFSDSPDFYGKFEDGERFWGDIGKVSASAFAMSQKMMRAHDLWISDLYNGRHVLIEPMIDIIHIFQGSLSKDSPYHGQVITIDEWNKRRGRDEIPTRQRKKRKVTPPV